jgi:hypothetical protein
LSKDEGETELETTGEGWVEDEGTFLQILSAKYLMKVVPEMCHAHQI